MCRSATKFLPALLLASFLAAQTPGGGPSAGPGPDWRRIGSSALELRLAGLATGPVDRVWFASDATRLFVRTADGRILETADFESWKTANGTPPPAAADSVVNRLPAGAAAARGRSRTAMRQYAVGEHAWRSIDGGRTWENLTGWQQESILGGKLLDAAVSPAKDDEVVVAGDTGVWRSTDGGKSWSSLNDVLPNLPVRKLASLSRGTEGVRITVEGIRDLEFEWAPGEKRAWRAVEPSATQERKAAMDRLSAVLQTRVTAYAAAGLYLHAGDANGRLWVSNNSGTTWSAPIETGGGEIGSIFTDLREPRAALAALDLRPGAAAGPRILRTLNGGVFWDDLTANLPLAGAHAVAADLETGAIYLATDRGLFQTYGNLAAAGPATPWTLVSQALPVARATDVRLDAEGNQLYLALDGYGVYAAMAPHRLRSPRVVSAADLVERAAAPGALLSVLGRRVEGARAGALTLPVLANSEAESQIQVPFDAAGNSLSLALDGRGGRTVIPLALGPVSPAIFVDRDGGPMILDGDSGVLLDAMTPARSGTRIQILATGLGRVRPDWPTGLAAPLDSPPAVAAPVKVFLDRLPLEVTRATLAPGYIGFYLVEAHLPDLVNAGPAELFIEAAGVASNRVRLYVEP